MSSRQVARVATHALFRCWLVVMVKEPVGGRVKSRLARQAGLSLALRFYRHSTAAVLDRLSRDPRWQTILAVTPDTALRSRCWPAYLRRIPQGGGDLGTRMQRIFDRLPAGPVLVVGSDIPGITAPVIAEAFRRLDDLDAILGPAGDGGYWLVGLRRRPRILRPFSPVRWSTRHALSDTRANLSGSRLSEAALLRDVDDLAALEAESPTVGRRVIPDNHERRNDSEHHHVQRIISWQ